MHKIFFGLAIGAMFCPVGASTACAQEIPAALQPPADQQRYLQVHAQGDQIYVCKSESAQFAWVLQAPEAQLTDVKGQAFGRHFGGPTWQAQDGSRVTGTVAMKVESPDADSIPWLLLNVAGHEGEGVLSRAKSIQRVNTKGGKAPGTGCDADHVNQEVRVRYTADYNFYAAK
jgi:Protein of unknown function (DUF3455)